MLFNINKSGKIYLLGTVIAAALLGSSLAIFLARNLVIQILIPLAAQYLSADGVITPQGLSRLNSALDWLRWLCLLGAGGVFAYAYLFEELARRLPLVFRAQNKQAAPVVVSEYVWIGAILVGALIFRAPHLSRGFFYDELFTTYHFINAGTWWETISSFIIFNNHILYSVLGRLSQGLFGAHEWAIRLPALVMGLGSIFLTWRMARSVLGKQIAVLAAALLAISPTHVLWSVSARGYTGLIFFALLSSEAFIASLDNPRKRNLGMYVLASAAAIYTHLNALWVVAGQFLYFSIMTLAALRQKKATREITGRSFRGMWLSFAAVGLLSALLYAPVFGQLLGNLGAQSGRGFLPSFPADFVREMAGDGGVQAGISFLLVLIGVVAIWRSHPGFLGYLGCLLAPSFLISWLILRPQNLAPRFFSFMQPYYVLLVIVGCLALWRWMGTIKVNGLKYASWGVLAVSIAFILFSWADYSWSQIPEEAQYREAIQALTAQVGPDATLCAFGADADIFQFYTERRLVLPKNVADLNALMGMKNELRCAYHSAHWNPPEFTRMAEILEARSDPLEFKRMLVFLIKP